MSWADLDGLAEGEGERDGVLRGERELACTCRLDLGNGESALGESGIDSGEAY